MGDRRKIQILTDDLGNTLNGQNFIKRGKSFYRIKGDGILQILDFNYEPRGLCYDLNIRLYSLYSSFCDYWGRPYSIMRFRGQDSATYLVQIGKHLFESVTVSPEEQLKILEEEGIPFLNSMRTQQHLLDGLFELERRGYHHHISWNDSCKLFPALCSKNYAVAEKICTAVLDQQAAAQNLDFTYDGKIYQFEEIYPKLSQYAQPVFYIWKLLLEENTAAIDAFLQKNYAENAERVKFCKKQKTSQHSDGSKENTFL